jgi:carbamoyltransferase
MNILGISCYYHDSAAALLQDGVVLAASQEERFSRVKNDSSFPIRAIEFCLAHSGITSKDLDYVVLHEKPLLKLERFLTSTLRYWPNAWSMFEQGTISWLKQKLWIRTRIIEELGISPAKVLFVEHHLSHASSAFFCSPFEKAAVMTIDGVGEWATATMGTAGAVPPHINLTHEMRFPHSLGLLYSTFTSFLGFEVNEGEYKVMGMAPYGEPKYQDELRRVVRLYNDGSLELDPAYFSFHYSADTSYTGKLLDVFGPPRPRDLEFITGRADTGEGPEELKRRNQHYADVAATVQKFTEDALVKMACHLRASTGEKNLCIAGGVALNSVANTKIFCESGFERVFIQPAAGDAGGALGAAQYVWHVLLGKPRTFVMEDAYLGRSYTTAEIATAFANTRGECIEDENTLVDRAVDDIVAGRVIGWAQGRFEWGPRALGNRSILADPRSASMKAAVNSKIKFREPFRPFAPVVPEEQVSNLFEAPKELDRQYPTRFMLMVVPWRQDAGARARAVNHLGTGRLQSLRSEWNPRYYALLRKFGQATGVPVLLNTSFNVRGEPIVASPTDALNTFRKSGIDVLYFGNFRLEK